ncbi:hypothetical protein pb186bvf_021139 [Paramecium bursaria]
MPLIQFELTVKITLQKISDALVFTQLVKEKDQGDFALESLIIPQIIEELQKMKDRNHGCQGFENVKQFIIYWQIPKGFQEVLKIAPKLETKFRLEVNFADNFCTCQIEDGFVFLPASLTLKLKRIGIYDRAEWFREQGQLIIVDAQHSLRNTYQQANQQDWLF